MNSNELTLQEPSTKTAKTPSRWLRILRRLLVVFVIFLAILGVTHTMWLPHLYRFLDVSEAPHKADFIVMLGSGTNRALETANLYHQGYADRVILSGCEGTIPSDRAVLEDAGVPDEAILINGHATNTWDEAQQILTLLQEAEAQSALIVTDAPHTRRAHATYQHFEPGSSLKLIFVAVPTSFSENAWWKSRDTINTVLKEYVKGVYYGIRYGIWFF